MEQAAEGVLTIGHLHGAGGPPWRRPAEPAVESVALPVVESDDHGAGPGNRSGLGLRRLGRRRRRGGRIDDADPGDLRAGGTGGTRDAQGDDPVTGCLAGKDDGIGTLVLDLEVDAVKGESPTRS